MADTKQLPAHVDGVAGLKKVDMKVGGVVFMLYCLVAAGAFGIEEMIPNGSGITLVMLIAFPFIWAWPISNLVAEAGSILPSEGGVYVWAKEAFGEFWGFQAGWYNTVSIYITNGVYTALVVDYSSKYIQVLGDSELMQFGLKMAMILIFTVINLLGLREVGLVSSILSVAIIVAFGVVAVVGLINWQYNPMEPFIGADPETGEVFSVSEALSGSLAICIWMYCGYECISTLAGEVKNPQVIPKGLIIAMPLIALTYVLPTLGGLVSVGDYQNWGTDPSATGYADVLTGHLGAVWGYVFLGIAIVSQCAIFNTYLASGSRGFFVLADDNLCPKFLVRVSKRRGVPYVGVLSLAIVTALLAQFGFTTLVMAEVVFILALYILLPLSVWKLRKIYPIEARKKQGCFVMPGGNAGIWFFAGIVLVISVAAFMINGTDYFLIGILACSTGPLFYVILKLVYGGVRDDPRYPLNPKTRLARGDLWNLSIYGIAAGALAVVGSFVLNWYEGDWGPEYYASESESPFFTDFEFMIGLLRYIGIGLLAFGVAMFLLGRVFEQKKSRPK